MRVWHNEWTGLSPLRNLIHGPLCSNEDDLLVKDLFGPQETWNFSKISLYIPKSIRDLVQGITRSAQLNKSDIPRWRDSPNGEFLSSSTYDT